MNALPNLDTLDDLERDEQPPAEANKPDDTATAAHIDWTAATPLTLTGPYFTNRNQRGSRPSVVL